MNPNPPHSPIPDSALSRRSFLKSSATATLAGTLGANGHAAAAESRGIIAQENAKPGSNDWQLTRVRLDKNLGFRSPLIEGYFSKQSVKAGESLDIFVSTKPAARFHIEIFRTGWYSGRGARLMKTLGPFDGTEQPVPPMGEKRLHECRWKACATLTIPDDWVSGVYLGRLTTLPEKEDAPYWQSYIVSDAEIQSYLAEHPAAVPATTTEPVSE